MQISDIKLTVQQETEKRIIHFLYCSKLITQLNLKKDILKKCVNVVIHNSSS